MSQNLQANFMTGTLISGQDNVDYFISKYVELNPEEFPGCDTKKEKTEEMRNRLCRNEPFLCSCAIGKVGDIDEFVGVDCLFYASLISDDQYLSTVSFIGLNEKYDQEVLWTSDSFIFVDSNKYLSTRDVLSGNFYTSEEELLSEMKDKIGAYLPEDFDFHANTGDVCFAICS